MRKKISARKELAEQNRLRNSFERGLAAKLQKIFKDVGDSVANEIAAGRPINVAISTIEARIIGVMTSYYREVIIAFSKREKRQIEQKQDSQFERYIREFIASEGTRNITSISQTTRELIQNAIQNAQKDGLGVQETAKAVREVMSGGFSKYRAHMIARTETHSAAGFANHAVAKNSGVMGLFKQWVATADDRTRKHHHQVDGQKVPIDDDFIVPYKGIPYRMAYVGDPRGGAGNVINCRCVILYLAPDDEVVDKQEIPKNPIPESISFDSFVAAPEKSLIFPEVDEANKTISDVFKAAQKDTRYPLDKDQLLNRFTTSTGDLLYDIIKSNVAIMKDAKLNKIKTQLAPVLEDLRKLSVMFNIPELRHIRLIRSNSRSMADMGDGGLGINISALENQLNKNGIESTWKRPSHNNYFTAEEANSRPWTSDAFFESGFDKFRATIFHEFGHHVHQMYKMSATEWKKYLNLRRNYSTPVETMLKNMGYKTNRSGSTRYSDANGVEWFAENFSLYCMGRKDLVDPQFLKLIKELADNAYK